MCRGEYFASNGRGKQFVALSPFRTLFIEFVVVICGDVMAMPDPLREPSAMRIRVNEAGNIEGLF